MGSLDKVTRVHQRLFRRSESAVINLSGGTVSGFIDCHFKVCHIVLSSKARTHIHHKADPLLQLRVFYSLFHQSDYLEYRHKAMTTIMYCNGNGGMTGCGSGR